jgi:hypothetical protein
MNRDDVDWQGYFPAVVTPFTEEGELDLASLEALAEYYAAQGMHGMVINGTCGEWFSQSHDERRAVAETAVSAAAGRMRVLVGCTDYTADEVVALARHRSGPVPMGCWPRHRRTPSSSGTRSSSFTRISAPHSTGRWSSTTGRTAPAWTSGPTWPTGWPTSTPSWR